jgi:hypothetical protein
MAAPAPVVSVDQALADLNAKRLTQAVVVQGTSDNLQANLAGLQKLAAAGKLSSLTFSDGGNSLQFTASQLSSHTALVKKLTDTGVNVSVADNAANMVHVASRLSASYQVSITDTAANVQKNLMGLQALSAAQKIDSLSFTDGVPTLNLNASQFATTVALRAQMTDASITVTDTAANMARYNVATANALVVKDTATNVWRNFDVLSTLASTSPDMSVQLSDKTPAMTLSAAQYVGSADLRSKLSSVTYTIKDTAQNIADNVGDLNGLKIAVTDTAAHVQSNLDVLQGFAETGKLSSLKVTDASTAKLTLSVAQALKVGVMSGTAIRLEDTAANIQSKFNELTAVKKISAIQLTDTARPLLEVTDAQYKNGSALLSKISGAAVSVKFSGNLNQYKITGNGDGSFSVGNTNYKKVNFFAFNDTTTVADTGDKNLNAMMLGGTNYWWRNTAGTVNTSDALVKANVYAMAAGSSKQTISYSFLTALPSGNVADSNGFKPMTDVQKAGVLRAFDYLSSLIGVTFVEATTPGAADINFGTNNQYSKSSAGYANVPNGSGDHPVYLFLDNGLGNQNTSMNHGGYGWQTLIHEIGHTLGLKHPGNYNASGGSMPGPFLPSALDNRSYTLMSYNNAPGTMKVSKTETSSVSYKYSASTISDNTYMMYDIAALQFLYGKGTAQNLDAYQVNSFTADWSGIETLWMPDNGTIDASNVTNSNIIDLRQGAFSSINVIPKSITDSFPSSLKTAATYMGLNNVGLAFGSQVTSAYGGSAADVFYTSTDSDVTIDGGAGNDTVYLAGVAADWVQTSNANTYVNAKLGRNVTLNNVEAIKYYNADTYTTTHSRLDISA